MKAISTLREGEEKVKGYTIVLTYPDYIQRGHMCHRVIFRKEDKIADAVWKARKYIEKEVYTGGLINVQAVAVFSGRHKNKHEHK